MACTSADGEDQGYTESMTPPNSEPPPAGVPTSFLDMLRECSVSAVHLEMRDAYTPKDPDYLRWMAGDHFDPAVRWPDLIEAVKEVVDEKGVAVRRARIISEPVTDYIRYEYAITSGLNVAAGESVRWLPRRRASDIALPGTDFWLFDDRLVLFNHFAGDGSSGDKELRNESEVVEFCAAAFEAVWSRAIPHEIYRPS